MKTSISQIKKFSGKPFQWTVSNGRQNVLDVIGKERRRYKWNL
jgi:hypothetical protein